MTADDFFLTDAHWNKNGHRKAAEVLFEYLDRKGGQH